MVVQASWTVDAQMARGLHSHQVHLLEAMSRVEREKVQQIIVY